MEFESKMNFESLTQQLHKHSNKNYPELGILQINCIDSFLDNISGEQSHSFDIKIGHTLLFNLRI